MADAVSSSLLTFYRGGADTAGRTLESILAWDDRRLEMVHDYIQWLFPLPEASRFNPDAPRLTSVEAALFRSDPVLADSVLRALDRMLAFYGLIRTGDVIVRGPAFASRGPVWLTPLNHNHLRLTRMLLSLGYLGRPALARALHACLADIAQREGAQAISSRTRQFWSDALRNPPPLTD
jgi:hypothetical protein